MSSQFLVDDLKREVVLRPGDPRARFQLAEVLFGDGQFRLAARQLEKALELGGDEWLDHDNARRLLAHCYERDGRPSEAQRLLEETVRRRPDELGARDELIELYLAIGRVDDALLHAEEAARLAPRDPKRLVTVSELSRMKGLFDRAREALESAQRLAPEDVKLAANLKELYLELGDEAASERVAGARGRDYFLAQAKAALKSDRVRGAVAPGELANVAARLELGDVAGAKRALTEAKADARALPGYQFLRGELLLVEGELERAERAFLSCVEHAPELGIAWNRLGDLSQSRGRLREAIPYYKKAIVLLPEDANAHEDLGDLYATLGDRAEAERMYAEAARRDPDGRAGDKLRSLTEPAKRVGSGGGDAPQVGRIGVLGWTPRGGAVSPLEAVAVVGKGELLFSGNVGPTGREASTVAFSCLKARARDLKIEELVTRYDLHLHFTDTEMSKDGPSSGLALILAGVSAYTQRPLRPHLAATGEITLLGEVKPVGGIHEKLVAAHLAGVRTVLLPVRNLREARELPDEVRAQLRIIHVSSVAEAIEKALV